MIIQDFLETFIPISISTYALLKQMKTTKTNTYS